MNKSQKLNKEQLDRLDIKIKDLDISRKEYIDNLILKDLDNEISLIEDIEPLEEIISIDEPIEELKEVVELPRDTFLDELEQKELINLRITCKSFKDQLNTCKLDYRILESSIKNQDR